MATKWTAEQQQVIDLRQRNLLVSAAAGSGKTAVLVERIYAMLTDLKNPVDIDQLLVVTFTNAAAAEMKERIEQRLQKALEETDKEHLASHIHRQLACIHSAQITTIHSFCMRILRNHFNEIDLDPAFRVGEDTELILMKGEVVRKLLDDYYEENPPGFLEFIESYARGKTDYGIDELVLKIYNFSQSHPWPLKWLEACRENFAIEQEAELEACIPVQFLKEHLNALNREMKQSLDEARALCADVDGPVFYAEALAVDQKRLEQFGQCESLRDYEQALSDLQFSALSRKRMPETAPEKKERVKQLREFVKDTLKSIKNEFFFTDSNRMIEDIKRVRPLMDILIQLVIDFSERYQCRKEDKNLLDFNDLEHLALKVLVNEAESTEDLLVPTPAALELSETFVEILCDEYQDSNMVQETLLRSISRERNGHPNMFMVGDVKQSIYKFRMAMPELFMEKYATYSLTDSHYQRIDLHKNFRSRAVVLDSANFIFRSLMGKELGDIDYDDDAALYTGAVFAENDDHISRSAGLLLVHAPEDEEDDETGSSELDMKELEALAVARKIKTLMNPDDPLIIWDKDVGIYRKAEGGDMVILLRTMSGYADTFVKILNQEGIPAQSETMTGFFETTEVRTVLNLLTVIDNPRQDIPLAALLKSPIGRMTDEDLVMIRAVCKNKSFYESCMAFQNPTADMFAGQHFTEAALTDTRRCLVDFFDLLQGLRSMVPYTSIHELILKAFEVTGYDRYAAAMPSGERRQANLTMLVEKAVAYENTSYTGLFNFVRYIEELKKYEVDFGEAGDNGHSRDTVRIMSIHKSKGLEFPVVFVSGLGKRFNQQDARSTMVVHAQYGLGPDAIDLDLRLRTPTLYKRILSRKTILENLGEELRVLYVALTRAKEMLIMTGTIKDMEKSLSRWRREINRESRRLSLGTMLNAGCFLDWVMPALLVHRHSKAFLEKYEQPVITGGPGYDDPSCFEIADITYSELKGQTARKAVQGLLSREMLENRETNAVYDPQLKAQLEAMMQWAYPYDNEATLHQKLSVSELKKLGQYEEDEQPLINLIDIPEEVAFAEKDEADMENEMNAQERMQKAALRGTAVHKIFEALDLYVDSYSIEDLNHLIAQLVMAERISREVAETINPRPIARFFQTPLFRRMQMAFKRGQLYRERQFVISIKASEIDPRYKSDEPVLIQGIIDAWFIEEGEAVIVDYKTDVVADDGASLIRRYQTQLDYYGKAVSQITGLAVKEKLIYSLGLSQVLYLE